MFRCSYRATQSVESDTVTVTRLGRVLLANGVSVSVILPDELVSIHSGVNQNRWARCMPPLSLDNRFTVSLAQYTLCNRETPAISDALEAGPTATQ